MNHRKLLLFTLRTGLITSITVLGRELPLREVSSPDCKGTARDDMDGDCRLSILDDTIPSDDINDVGNLIFSALRGASYTNPHMRGDGSHPSLDIATNQGTPVYSIQEGEVVKAGFLNGGYGNSITVKHIFKDTFIYSNYSHLDTIEVTAGQRVKEGQKIGEVGRSGFTVGAYGYHLDFQITTDKSPSHPYGFHDCESSYVTTVNLGLCKDKLKAYTIDPMEFFKEYGVADLFPVIGVPSSTSSSSKKSENKPRKKIYTLPKNIDDFSIPTRSTNDAVDVFQQEMPASEGTVVEEFLAQQQVVVSPPTHLVETVEAKRSDQEPYVLTPDKRYRIRREVSTATQEKSVGKFITFTVYVEDPTGNPLSGTLHEKLFVSNADNTISVLPSTISSVLQGKKHVFLKLLTAGETQVTLHYGDQQIGEMPITIK